MSKQEKIFSFCLSMKESFTKADPYQYQNIFFRNDLIDLLIDEMNKSKSDAATANGEANQFESEFEADAAMNTDDVKAGDNI